MLFSLLRDIFFRTQAGKTRRSCKCCNAVAPYFGSVDFSKNCEEIRGVRLPADGREIPYFRCSNCGFLFTDYFDQWSRQRFLDDIYNGQYESIDPDFLEARPETNANVIHTLFGAFKRRLSILDYGGGRGVLAGKLGTHGFARAATFDPYFGGTTEPVGEEFDMVCSFEVFEHMPNPRAGLADALRFLKEDGLLLFSTVVQPGDIGSIGLSWWYAAPRNGHISLHTRASLAILAREHGMQLHSFDDNLHIAFRRLPDFAQHLHPPAHS